MHASITLEGDGLVTKAQRAPSLAGEKSRRPAPLLLRPFLPEPMGTAGAGRDPGHSNIVRHQQVQASSAYSGVGAAVMIHSKAA
jgi:hypothetical protein